MCGRYTLTPEAESFKKHFRLKKLNFNYQPRYNIAPAQNIPVIINREGEREAVLMRWGLIPGWARDASIGSRLINARAETIEQKPSFKNLFTRRRCLVPADGFFEWKKEKEEKYPVRAILPGDVLFAFAGIWDLWYSPLGKKILSCSIITSAAGSFLRKVHFRMPVILAEEEAQEQWLNSKSKKDLRNLLMPYKGEIITYKVPDIVNSPANDVPQCIEKLE